MPSTVFIQVLPEGGGSQCSIKKDVYKPQFIDFQSPVSNLLFEKIIKKAKGNIKIEEMLPSENELLKDGNQHVATEFVVQWKKEK